jgi:hypothetical protein
MQGSLLVARRSGRQVLASSSRLGWFSSSSGDLPTTQTPPPNAARGATADLCDIFITDPVDKVTHGGVQIAQPIFKCVSRFKC